MNLKRTSLVFNNGLRRTIGTSEMAKFELAFKSAYEMFSYVIGMGFSIPIVLESSQPHFEHHRLFRCGSQENNGLLEALHSSARITGEIWISVNQNVGLGMGFYAGPSNKTRIAWLRLNFSTEEGRIESSDGSMF